MPIVTILLINVLGSIIYWNTVGVSEFNLNLLGLNLEISEVWLYDLGLSKPANNLYHTNNNHCFDRPRQHSIQGKYLLHDI